MRGYCWENFVIQPVNKVYIRLYAIVKAKVSLIISFFNKNIFNTIIMLLFKGYNMAVFFCVVFKSIMPVLIFMLVFSGFLKSFFVLYSMFMSV